MGLVAGAVLLLLSHRFSASWLFWVGIGILAVAFLLRYLPQPRDNSPTDGPQEGPE